MFKKEGGSYRNTCFHLSAHAREIRLAHELQPPTPSPAETSPLLRRAHGRPQLPPPCRAGAGRAGTCGRQEGSFRRFLCVAEAVEMAYFPPLR